ncbi:MAG: cation transporter [Oscillospiraceae bacterium]|nr:cation transporter [Oscillospiraceae bacterium]
MTRFLLALFVKNYPDGKDPRVRGAIGVMAGITGIVCNVLLFLGKLICGILTGAVSIIADAANNLSDAASSGITFLGFRLARRPADADHPYGHARYEYLSALVVSMVILLLGAELTKSAIGKILHPQTPVFSWLTVGILAASILVKLWLWRFYKNLGKRIGSGVLAATGIDSRNDCVATLGVLAGFVLEKLFGFPVDGWIGLAVALFILWSGIGIARQTVSSLLGQRADPELTERISALVLSHEKILGIHDLLVHDYGPGQCFASLHAELSAEEDPLSCHDIIDDIECDALHQLNVHLVIHYDPVEVNDEERSQMQVLVEEIVENIHYGLSVHDFRIVRGAKQTKLVFDLAVPYGVRRSHRQLKESIDEKLGEKGIFYTTVIRFDGK